ncbi:DUF4251 domain-containing protein [Pedobacter insulae]|uniref:DUF4251 domain-containing protein n=1 Tax=Pedobacter insulae TaxID=414048 RepID=A0A1I2YWJ2_9SPHI|nr:DUF4251 domain-containing protein [Pedobacter insulae]SFH30038.1 protein of unknown function [Pedobacter insulae]
MNRIKIIISILLAFISIGVNAQTDKETTKRIIEAKDFVFIASSAIPMNSAEINNILSRMPGGNGGGTISLTGGNYDVRITPDSLVAYLPYYGRAFSAPMDRNESGFKFTSTKFSYQNVTRKKGGWQITINPKDTKENIRMNFSVSQNGYASLVVSSNNKQSINYNGYLAEPKK